MMIKTIDKRDNIGVIEIWSWKKIYNHSQPFHWFKKGSYQLLAKDWTLNIGKTAQEACPGTVSLG